MAGIGGDGGIGGPGGDGGLAPAFTGSYTNDSTDPVVLVTFVGTTGADGAPGVDGAHGVDGDAMNPDGGFGGAGEDGGAGAPGGPTIINAANDTFQETLALAAGGVGGEGGTGGTGGTGTGDNGLPGCPGDPGLDGVGGTIYPDPLPEGWTLIANDGTPRVVFEAATVPPTTPPTTTVPPTTTIPSTPPTTPPTAPPTTTVPPTTVPVPDATGELPVTAPGTVQVIENNTPVTVNLRSDGTSGVSISTPEFQVSVIGNCNTAVSCPITPSPRPTVLLLPSSPQLIVSGTGFMARSTVHAWTFDPGSSVVVVSLNVSVRSASIAAQSTPGATYLGPLEVAADGSFAGTFDFPFTREGAYTVQLNGLAPSGAERTTNVGVSLAAAESPDTSTPGTLPDTGGSNGALVPAMLLLAAGAAIMLTARRRTTH